MRASGRIAFPRHFNLSTVDSSFVSDIMDNGRQVHIVVVVAS